MFEPQTFAIFIFLKNDRAETLFRICLVYSWYTGLLVFWRTGGQGKCLFLVYVYTLYMRYWYTAFFRNWYTYCRSFSLSKNFLSYDYRTLHLDNIFLKEFCITGVLLQEFRTTEWPAPKRKINMPSEKCSSNLQTAAGPPLQTIPIFDNIS